MNKNNIDKLFEDLEGSFNVHETPAGHQKRFMNRLNSVENKPTKKIPQIGIRTWKSLSIAASIAVLIAVGVLFTKGNPSESDLASVSPEMMQTQSFFTTTINKELQTLKSLNKPEAKSLVADALQQLDILEKEYEGLKKDLAESGNDKRVIYAMINNFQTRINLLEQVIEKIEEIKNLKKYRDETTI
jgi:hypothetical protein